jgi:hypothetical protein
MTFHLPSFLLGFVAGNVTGYFARELRPVAVDVATAGVQLWDAAWSRIVGFGEDVEDVVAEAKARARNAAGAGGA